VGLQFRIASELNYSIIRLHILPQMKESQLLYKQFGFHEIESYRFNPIEGAVYMEKELL